MIFDWHALAGIGAAVFMIVGTVPYIRDMLRGETRPNMVSWSIWAFAVGISATAQFTAEPSWSVVLVGTTFFMDSTVLVFALFGYGYSKFEWWDGLCLTLSLAALALWWLSGDPLIALGFAIIADGFAFLPTFIKSYREPFSETPVAWLLFGLSGLTGLGAASVFDFASTAFPVYFFIANCSLWILILVRQHLKKA